MAITLSTSDLILLTLVFGVGFYWLFGDSLTKSKEINDLGGAKAAPGKAAGDGDVADERDFVAKMNKQNKKAVIFWGSQTGTAEDYATRIAKEAKSRFGVSSLVADPEEYDFEHLDKLTSDQLAIFVVATYGEGEPTDNSIAMVDFIKDAEAAFSEGGKLENLKYVVFALGNRTYELFCQMGIVVDESLAKHGATRIGTVGMGDDDKSMEEDYLEWKEPMWAAVQAELGWEEGAGGDNPDFEVKELVTIPDEKRVYRGELSPRALSGTRGVFDAKNPYPSPIIATRELFRAGDRNCVHIEFDITDTGIRYQTGDHLGLWPLNPDHEVARLMKILGLWEKRDTVVDITSLDPALAKVPFPNPASYDAIFRHYLDISMVASRQLLSQLAKFAPTEAAQEKLAKIGSDKEYYSAQVAERCLKLGECLMLASGEDLNKVDPLDENFKPIVWNVPFEKIVSGVQRLQPRFYSISSSPRLYPNAIHVTCVILKYAAGEAHIYGCGSNYILNMKMDQHGEAARMLAQPIDHRHSGAPNYRLEGPRGKYKAAEKIHAPVHVRRSNFRLPTSPKIPVVMVGPGTGVAPFRAFLQERVALARKAKEKDGPDALSGWGSITLYYGCRNDDDFLYKEEWEEYKKELDGKFTMHVALSRVPGIKKTYVQHMVEQNKADIAEAIVEKKGFMYICGDARNMAHDVEDKLKAIFAEKKGGTAEKEGAAEVKLLKERNRLLLDVWS